ncbi:hypothetical protein M758_5G035700 [Ceratodon purpureus]|nr:hypothetical protein M758_5G035700 [Ceratodon purpureus]
MPASGAAHFTVFMNSSTVRSRRRANKSGCISRKRTSRMLMLPLSFLSGPSTTGSPPTPLSFISLNASSTSWLAVAATTLSGVMSGRPSWSKDLEARLSNQSRPWHCERPRTTAVCVMTFFSMGSSWFTTGMLRSWNLDNSNSTVSMQSSIWIGRKGAHLYAFVISTT